MCLTRRSVHAPFRFAIERGRRLMENARPDSPPTGQVLAKIG
jgi:hypothetical protein